MFRKRANKLAKKDAGAMAIFVGAITALLIVCCYVVSRLSGERAYREKWQDYNDCGWA